ncbi:MAG: DsbC family protein [Rhodocyclaceae bacterium]|nr:DsbC family protein [Rhodocyclaceae bacterium]MCE2979248.1 DsbC family protein [Betaproteobacteria bacterium]MCA3072931.1 DsbC family protein [Rhodocyclaceae bacterium]MCA3088620.1 DsbC family protein [Rhodocyclaceae bacterium]MCA3092596.1 DsbC family protein [Rhodocyclaceae bacterium]
MNRLAAALAAPILAILLALAGGSGVAAAQTPEDNLRKLVEAKMPGERVREIRRTPLPGVYEVAFGNRLFYADEGLNYLIIGQIIESATNRNLTDQRLRQLTAIDVKQLPLDAAIKTVKGDGRRILYVFSDPLCPFCSQLEQELQKVTNVTVYTFLTPVEQMRPGSRNRALEIWCSSDRRRAWDEWMLKQVAPVSKPTCRNPLEQVVKLSDKLGFTVTPTLVFADGAVLSGMIPAAQIEKFMNAVAPAPAPAKK